MGYAEYITDLMRDLISMSTDWGHGPNPLMRYSPPAFFLVELVSQYGWVRDFLFPELGFATLVPRFRIHFVKEACSDLCPANPCGFFFQNSWPVRRGSFEGCWYSAQFWLQYSVVDYPDSSWFV